jgi:hypothetical protein
MRRSVNGTGDRPIHIVEYLSQEYPMNTQLKDELNGLKKKSLRYTKA